MTELIKLDIKDFLYSDFLNCLLGIVGEYSKEVYKMPIGPGEGLDKNKFMPLDISLLSKGGELCRIIIIKGGNWDKTSESLCEAFRKIKQDGLISSDLRSSALRSGNDGPGGSLGHWTSGMEFDIEEIKAKIQRLSREGLLVKVYKLSEENRELLKKGNKFAKLAIYISVLCFLASLVVPLMFPSTINNYPNCPENPIKKPIKISVEQKSNKSICTKCFIRSFQDMIHDGLGFMHKVLSKFSRRFKFLSNIGKLRSVQDLARKEICKDRVGENAMTQDDEAKQPEKMKCIFFRGKHWYLMPCQEFYNISRGHYISYMIVEDTVGQGEWESGHVVIEDQSNGDAFMWTGVMFDPQEKLRPCGIYDPEIDFFGFLPVNQVVKYEWLKK